MHKVQSTALAFLTALLGVIQSVHAGNPLTAHVCAADPSARIWPGDDRLWPGTSLDQTGTNRTL
jgi:hypothetical protein